jgi:hypothetical protein
MIWKWNKSHRSKPMGGVYECAGPLALFDACATLYFSQLLALVALTAAPFFAYNRPMRRRKPHHHVYVVELSKDVLDEPRFRKNNPGYIDGKPCVYVGMTGLDPDVRFDKHKAGIQANRFVTQYGLRLLPDLYEGFNPMGYEEAVDREIEIGIDLRSAGFGVWQA